MAHNSEHEDLVKEMTYNSKRGVVSSAEATTELEKMLKSEKELDRINKDFAMQSIHDRKTREQQIEDMMKTPHTDAIMETRKEELDRITKDLVEKQAIIDQKAQKQRLEDLMTKIAKVPHPTQNVKSEEWEGSEHYTSLDIEPWQAMEEWLTPREFVGFLKGCAIKRLARAHSKGVELEDLIKARHELDKAIELLKELVPEGE